MFTAVPKHGLAGWMPTVTAQLLHAEDGRASMAGDIHPLIRVFEFWCLTIWMMHAVALFSIAAFLALWVLGHAATGPGLALAGGMVGVLFYSLVWRLFPLRMARLPSSAEWRESAGRLRVALKEIGHEVARSR